LESQKRERKERKQKAEKVHCKEGVLISIGLVSPTKSDVEAIEKDGTDGRVLGKTSKKSQRLAL